MNTPSLDLNRTATPCSSQVGTEESIGGMNNEDELSCTIEVGNLIGIDIDRSNKILLEDLGVNGETIVSQ